MQKVKDGFLYGLGFVAASSAISLSAYLVMLLLSLLMHLGPTVG